MRFIDQLGRSVLLDKTPQRIVSLVPSQTDLLVDLGLESQLVGVTKFCVHPKSIRKQAIVVGGTKNVNYTKVEALQPDIIICNKEENTEGIVINCQKIAPVWVSDISTIEDSLAMIHELGEVFDKKQEALTITNGIKSEVNSFKGFIANKPLRKVLYLIWKKPYMAAGNDTFIHELLQLNKFENNIKTNRYPEVSLSELKQAELILLSSEPYPFKDKDVKEIRSQTNAEVRLVDGEYFSWYGSRLLKAFNYFKSLY